MEREREKYDFAKLLQDWCECSHSRDLKNITILMKLAAIVPGSTAVVESAWSKMNLLCDKHSAHTEQEHLDLVMHINMFKEKFDWPAIFELWKTMRNRNSTLLD